MSSAVNFNDMPVHYGLLYAFDCNTYIEGDIWTDFFGKSNFALTNAVKSADGAIDFTVNSGDGVLSVEESYNDSTEYYILKTNGTGTTTTTYYALVSKNLSDTTRHTLCYVGGANPSVRYFGAFEKTNGSNSNFVKSAVSAATDYHVVAVNRVGNTHRIFIDGALAITQNGMTVFAPTQYKIWDITIIRCAVICKAAHSEGEILENSNWLLEQYGLKPKSKNSLLAGTDAVAIAYAIARNQESAAALQQVKKAFEDGVHEGNDTVIDKTEPLPNDDDEVIIAGGDDDTFPAEFERGGLYIKTKEITVTDDDGNEVTGVFQLHIGLGEMTSLYYPTSGKYDWGYPPKVTLTGNGINKTQTFTAGWKGSTSASAPGVTDGNEMWMVTAKIYKSTARFGGTYYWEYNGSYASRYWELTGDFATALRNGDYVSTLPFDDVHN